MKILNNVQLFDLLKTTALRLNQNEDLTNAATTSVGDLYYDTNIGALKIRMSDNVELEIGLEDLVKVYNSDTVELTDGMAVYPYIIHLGDFGVKRADNTSRATSLNTLGLVTEPIAVESYGYVATRGRVRNVNTNAFGLNDEV